jgi:hypothetical protein
MQGSAQREGFAQRITSNLDVRQLGQQIKSMWPDLVPARNLMLRLGANARCRRQQRQACHSTSQYEVQPNYR